MNDMPMQVSDCFDAVADTYDETMKKNLSDSFAGLYGLIFSPITKTNEAISILDLGCATGLELKAVFSRAPGALITGVDSSEKMFSVLKDKYQRLMSQIRLIHGPFEQALQGRNMTIFSQ